MRGFVDVTQFGAIGQAIETQGSIAAADLNLVEVPSAAGWTIGAGIGIATAIDGAAALRTRVVDIPSATTLRLRDAAGVAVMNAAVTSDDRDPIQDAIDSLGSIGGLVSIPAGVYVLGTTGATDNSPLIVGGRIRLVGAGEGSTILRLAADVRQPVPGFPFGSGTVDITAALLLINRGNTWYFRGNNAQLLFPGPDAEIGVAHLTLDGTKDLQVSIFSEVEGPLLEATATGIFLDQVTRVRIREVEIANCALDGLTLGSTGAPTDEVPAGVRDSVFDTVWIHDCGRDGVAVTGFASSLRFTNCWLDGSPQAAFDLDPSFGGLDMRDISLLNCRLSGSRLSGLNAGPIGPGGDPSNPAESAVENLSLLNCEFEDNVIGVMLQSNSGGQVRNCRLIGCVFRGQRNVACIVSTAGHGVIFGCDFDQNPVLDGPGSGDASQLIFDNSALNWRVIGNRFQPSAEGQSAAVNPRGDAIGMIIVANHYEANEAGNVDFVTAGYQPVGGGRFVQNLLRHHIIHSNSGIGRLSTEPPQLPNINVPNVVFDLSTDVPLPQGGPLTFGSAGRNVVVPAAAPHLDIAIPPVPQPSGPAIPQLAIGSYQVNVSPHWNTGGWYITNQSALGFRIEWQDPPLEESSLEWTISL